jgi:hypothetical protein
VDVASLFAFAPAPPTQADGVSGLRGSCPPPGDQFGSALELALQGEPHAATAGQAGFAGVRDTAVSVLSALAFFQATGDGGAVPNLAGDGVNADDQSAEPVSDDQTAAMLAAMAGDAAIAQARLESRPHVAPVFQPGQTEGHLPATREDGLDESAASSVAAQSAEVVPVVAVPQPVAAAAPSVDIAKTQTVTDGPSPTGDAHPSVPPLMTRSASPGSGGHGTQAYTAPTLDGRRPSDDLPPAGTRVDGLPAAARESVQTTDPAAGDLGRTNPVPLNLPAQPPDPSASHPLNAGYLPPTAESQNAPQPMPAAEAGQASVTWTTGWRAPDGAPSRAAGAARYAAQNPVVPTDPPANAAGSHQPVPEGLAEKVLAPLQSAWPTAEAAATPRPAPAQHGGTTFFPSAPPAAQVQTVAEPARATEPLIPRQDDAAALGPQTELPELIEGKVSKAYLRGQALDTPAPEPELAARTFAGAEPRTAGDGPPERDGRHHQGARQPLSSGSFTETLAGGGGLGQVFSVRGPEAPAREASPAPQEPTSGGEPLDQAIVKSLKVQWNQGAGEARLRLHPEFLGELSVSLRVIGASVTAVLQSDSPAVREWVQAHQADLRRALEDAGLSLDNLVVDEDGHSQEQREQPAQDGQRRPARQKPEAGRFEALL